jgi:hypothetical protein
LRWDGDGGKWDEDEDEQEKLKWNAYDTRIASEGWNGMGFVHHRLVGWVIDSMRVLMRLR